MLEVINKNEVLVVDSRLIAQELGIEHKTLKDTIRKYLEEIEIEYGTVAVQQEPSKARGGGGNGEIFYYLTEEQATYLMTLSQNTDKVRKAKVALSAINPELLELLSNMANKMNTLTARTARLDAIDKSTETKKGIKGIIETEIENCYSDDLSYTVREYLVMKKQSLDYLATMRKRAIGFYKQSCQVEELQKKGNEVVFVGSNIAFLDQALKTVLGLD